MSELYSCRFCGLMVGRIDFSLMHIKKPLSLLLINFDDIVNYFQYFISMTVFYTIYTSMVPV